MSPASSVNLRSGNTMPVLGLGSWQLTHDTAGTVEYALRLGYRLVDTSSDYGTQPGIGQAVKRSGVPRDELFITAKVEETDDAYPAVKQYLHELQLEYADLVVIHRPPVTGAGVNLWKGLMQAQEEGLAQEIGVSNYREPLIRELIDATGEVPAVNQIEWSPFGHSKDMLDFCRQNRIVIQAYSPLTRAKRLDDPRLLQLAGKYGMSPAQILLRWDMQLGVVPIPKANEPSHLKENIDVFDFKLSDDDMALLAGMNERYSSLGTLPYV